MHYAKKGYEVDAIELAQSNVDVLVSKITDDMNIRAIQGNALDLSMYPDNTFDITLSLGPLYHLFKPEEAKKAIDEAIRVTKPNGKIFIAFILFDLTALSWGFQQGNIYDNIGEGKQVSSQFTPNNDEKLIFNLRYFSEVKEMMKQYNIDMKHYVATDGIGKIIKNEINNMSDKEYNLYLKYHLSICEREDLIGYSGHILVIGDKL